MNVFIGWSGERSKKVAKALFDWLAELFLPIDLWVSFEDDPGKRWQDILSGKLLDAEFGILCMTPGNTVSPWILYEAGALSKSTICPYLYKLSGEDLPDQLQPFGWCVADEEGTRKLLDAITHKLRERKGKENFDRSDMVLDNQFKKTWPSLNEKLQEIDKSDVDGRISTKIAEAQPKLWKALEELKGKKIFLRNTFYRSLLVKYLEDSRRTLAVSKAYFDVPYILYPAYLIKLLEDLRPNVKALAIVDAYEHFWRQPEGEIICNQTPQDSTRVFVFDKPELLQANLDLLCRHAEKYNVYVLSLMSLASERPDQSYDFSLIGSTEMTLLAKYESIVENGIPGKQIRFSAMESEISRHEKAINDVIHAAFKVNPDGTWQVPARLQGSVVGYLPRNTDIEFLSDAVFKPEVQSLPRRQVEMSAYIDVLKYDKYERQHPYYMEMMSKMLELIQRSSRPSNHGLRILELGAGTGIFTTMLLQLPSVHVTALEIDWACFHLLRQNVESVESEIKKRGSSYELLNNDSRSTNPDGTFDFIVSAFADHHIYPLDKKLYFRNVKRNLQANATFIVGDEFLPEYDIANETDRRNALNAYHNYIVSLALAAGHSKLIELEEEARTSGLTSKGDYKLSYTHYEKLLLDAGLQITGTHKIGPLEAELSNVGGVFVLEIKV